MKKVLIVLLLCSNAHAISMFVNGTCKHSTSEKGKYVVVIKESDDKNELTSVQKKFDINGGLTKIETVNGKQSLILVTCLDKESANDMAKEFVKQGIEAKTVRP